ncbi:hypothetical protein EHQ92_12850 [Leptospira biflexa]|uniref:hypothetical protein n=1 Tax=Leptospira biflexa TaxID=172 RepID=UPI001090D6F5|nr:hypothetical protein [Leptospira biflexa]TGM44522.1 hypothetical protein EHQ92_12850 [Leptospira biflexa]TGM45436.1 hypothetical protein EHQ88_14650 [Leptospira biflexa]
MKDKIFVFDFDGVVCDSTDECMITSWNTWQKWNGRNLQRRQVVDFTEEEILNFRKLRPRVRGAGEYFILNKILDEKITIDNQNDYELLLANNRENIQKFKILFLSERQIFRAAHPTDWILLHSVYPEVINLLRDLNLQNRLYIATLKDFLSIRMILDYYSVNVEDSKIVDEAKIVSKLDALEKILLLSDTTKEKLIFFDDNVTHLFESFSNGFEVYLTAWSNPIPEYLEQAKIARIPIVRNFEQLNLIINKG